MGYPSSVHSFLALVVLLFAIVHSAHGVTYKYRQSSRIGAWNKIDLDVRNIRTLSNAGKFFVARNIYRGGKFNKPRSLRALSSPALNRVVQNIFSKKSPYQLVENGFISETAAKYMQYHVMMRAVMSEMDMASKMCRQKSFFNSGRWWDRAIGDYKGSQVNEAGKGKGFLLHTGALDLCSRFGDGGACYRSGGMTNARVNDKFYTLANEGKGYINGKKCWMLDQVRRRMVKLLLVPTVQGCIHNIVRTKLETDEEMKSKAHGAAWAYCSALFPEFSKCSNTIEQLLKRQLSPLTTNPMSGNPSFVIRQVINQFKCMGITCDCVGNYIETEGYPVCFGAPGNQCS